jgi:hypothetical protein
MPVEKRKAKRVKKESKITLKVISGETVPRNRTIIYHLTKDISFKGVKIETNTFLPINTLLKIELSLTKPPRAIKAIGRVRWIKSRYADEKFEMGIEFIDTPKESIKALTKHIESLS